MKLEGMHSIIVSGSPLTIASALFTYAIGMWDASYYAWLSTWCPLITPYDLAVAFLSSGAVIMTGTLMWNSVKPTLVFGTMIGSVNLLNALGLPFGPYPWAASGLQLFGLPGSFWLGSLSLLLTGSAWRYRRWPDRRSWRLSKYLIPGIPFDGVDNAALSKS